MAPERILGTQWHFSSSSVLITLLFSSLPLSLFLSLSSLSVPLMGIASIQGSPVLISIWLSISLPLLSTVSQDSPLSEWATDLYLAAYELPLPWTLLRGNAKREGERDEQQRERRAVTVWFLFLFLSPFSSVQSFVLAFRNALFDWQLVTDQLPPKAAWQREVTAQEGI